MERQLGTGSDSEVTAGLREKRRLEVMSEVLCAGDQKEDGAGRVAEAVYGGQSMKSEAEDQGLQKKGQE